VFYRPYEDGRSKYFTARLDLDVIPVICVKQSNNQMNEWSFGSLQNMERRSAFGEKHLPIP
jgi:hypothetical protein